MFLQFEIIYSIKALFPNVYIIISEHIYLVLNFICLFLPQKMKCWSPTAEEGRGPELEIFSNL